MKKVKRIIAGMAAAVMAFSTMSISASAYNTSQWTGFFLHYNSAPYIPSSENVTSQYIGNNTTQAVFWISQNGILNVTNRYTNGYFDCDLLTTQGFIWDPYVHAWSYTLQYSSTTPESGTHYANNGNAFAGLNARVREYFPGSLTSNQSVMGETKAF